MTARPTHASWRAHDSVPSNPPATRRRRLVALGGTVALVIGLAACGDESDGDTPAADDPADTTPDTTGDTAAADDPADTTGDTTGDAGDPSGFTGTLRIGAIPDQDPEVLQRQFGLVSDHLSDELGVEVEYVPVTDYQGAVSGFAVGDLDLVWFGGLTGVQARLEVDGAEAIAQRDIDADFTSVFIAGSDVGIEPFDTVDGLTALEGHSFTFGSESSTSGRLMPQYFLAEAGVDVDEDLAGEPGFSGSHDATIELVAAGTYETGALNSQVWDARVEEGAVDTDEVIEIFRTPPYFDYHWVANAGLDDTFGDGFTDAVTMAFVELDPSDPDDAEILALFGAGAFIPTEDANYAAIEGVARDIGAIR